MDQIIRRRVVVHPGGSIEVHAEELREGMEADVIVIVHRPESATTSRESALDLLDALPGRRLFKTPTEADEYLREERDSWDR